MLRLTRVTKIYQHAEVLKDASWEVVPGERVGLVGVNGSGKTTQFKIILGEVEPSSGEVTKPASHKIGYLSQEFDINPENPIREELLAAFTEAHKIKQELAAVEKRIETCSGEDLDRAVRALDRLHREFEAIDGYGLERKVDKILPEIGFATEDGDRPVSALSGGWQMRIGFGKIMLREPELLLLDEPTNHIDLETIEWLEAFLKEKTIPMVIVSHDRRFLDQLTTKIVEIERGKTRTFKGNYSLYREQKEEERISQQAAFERQQNELARQQVFIDRFRASATRSTQAKSREKQLDKIEKLEAPESELKAVRFQFPEAVRSGKEVLAVEGLTHSYDDNILFLDANLEVSRGDKIAILGPNGVGKSTLLRLIAGMETPLEGKIQLGEHNIHMAYFEQNQAEALGKEKTVLDTIGDVVTNWTDTQIRSLLGQFLFSGDSVFKTVGTLSGGEKARLALAKLLTSKANFILLDEPTNHLDIPAKETIEKAIQAYEGAMLLVSHDRYFISKTANKIAVIEDATIRIYEGNYDYYLERERKEKAAAIKAVEDRDRAVKQEEKRKKRMEKEKERKEIRASKKVKRAGDAD